MQLLSKQQDTFIENNTDMILQELRINTNFKDFEAQFYARFTCM